ncbi:sphingosine kinase related protein [Tieghemostelium lacteum]|uniref:Sphingosine kinase related protein n=1 Tax=Tieghemostelium lacteum TaxID=361077 RepID=A0A152A278_TIELA|nr:sphingosine kinase related protein [Tieghemostelium lacteum]|eukprot:KYR00326.1 sphingosine kinase related protein [Tieghemostelium lacteum]
MDINKDFVLCQACNEVYDEPYSLSCGDSVCLSCINKAKIEGVKEFECPLCKEQVGGYKLQLNIKKLVDTYKEEQLKDTHKCLTHKHIRLSLYCETCHQPICQECSKTTHAEHKLIDINRDQFQKCYNDLLRSVEELEGARAIKSNQLFLLESDFKSIQESYDSQIVETELLFKSLREFLENREFEVKRQLKSYYDTNLELFEKNMQLLDEHKNKLSMTIDDINTNDYLKLTADELFREHKYFVVLQNYHASKLQEIVTSAKLSPLEIVKFRKVDLKYHSNTTIQERMNRMIKVSMVSNLTSQPSQGNLTMNTTQALSAPNTPTIAATKQQKRKSGLFKSNESDSILSTKDKRSTMELKHQPSTISLHAKDDSDYSDDEQITLGSTTSNGSLDDLVNADISTIQHGSFANPQVQKITIKNITLVYNPFSGSKIGEKIMNQAKKFFEEHHVAVNIIPTEYKNHAEDICRTLDVTNVDVVCMIGGDGTIHEAVNGIMKRDADSRNKFVLACLPAGTGNSFVLELQGKLNIKYICKRILMGITTPIDIARVTVLTKEKITQECAKKTEQYNQINEKYGQLINVDKAMLTQSQSAGTLYLEEAKKGVRPDTLMQFGQTLNPESLEEDTHVHPEVIYSFNSLHWGLGSRINIRAEKLRWMGKAVRYTTAALLEMFKGEKILARIEYEDADGVNHAIEDEFCLGIINNIQGAAKGMKMAPKAKLNDGLIDLILIKSQKTIDLMSIFAKIYDGTHTELDYVIYKQVKRFSITPFKKDKERKKLMKKEKKRISKASGDDEVHSDKSLSHLEIFKGDQCGSNTILSKLKDDIEEEIIDIDGELKGTTPFVCEMLPRSIRVIV